MGFSKVCLINLPSPWLISDRDLPPLGLLYLAGALRANGVEVQIADLAGVPEEHWQIPEGSLYGISLTTPQFPYARKVVQKLRSRTSHCPWIIGGGAHVSALPVESLADLELDAVVVGEGDEALVQLALTGVGDTIMYPRPVDVKKLAKPARDLVDIRSYHRVDTNNYVLPGARYEGYLQSARGCPYQCSFCAAGAVTGRRVRYRPIPDVIEEIEELRDKYECELVYIEDDTFNLRRDRLFELCGALQTTGIAWHCLCRADHLDEAMLGVMAESGCKCVTFGFESGSNAILKAMKKGTTVEQGLLSAELVHRAGMKVRGQMIVGFPGETDETIRETEAFVRQAAVDKWGFHAFVPLPGSDVWNHPERYDFSLVKEDVDFGKGFQTIGKPEVWDEIRTANEAKTREWLAHLIGITRERNIFVGESK